MAWATEGAQNGKAGGGRVRCPCRHNFDVARQGHLNLLGGAGSRGLIADTADMVAARDSVQAAGAFAPVADALASGCARLELPGGGLLDLGGGTGYYPATVLDALPGRAGVSLDLSVYAARRAARAHDRLGSVVADAWRDLPVRDAAIALAMCVFAPRNPGELCRVVAPGGAVVVVTPRPGHLAPLVEEFGLLGVDPDKPARLARQFDGFALEAETAVTSTWPATARHVADLVLMGPSARHRDAARLREAIGDMSRQVRLDVRIGVYRRN